MASDGGGAIGSTFFEVRLDDIPPEEPKPEKQKGTGGMSFNVDLGKSNLRYLNTAVYLGIPYFNLSKIKFDFLSKSISKHLGLSHFDLPTERTEGLSLITPK